MEILRLLILKITVFTVLITFFTGCRIMESNPLTYGAFVQNGETVFRLYAPKAEKVYLVIFEKYDDLIGKELLMTKEGEDWSLSVKDIGYGTLYGYRLEGNYPGNDPNVIVADPYSKAAVTQNTYQHVAKSLIVDTSFDWGNDSWMNYDWRDLIIYEMHIRDMTTHETSNSQNPGTYSGLIDPKQKEGINHLKEMGVNAVQILPMHDFANVEIPFKDKSAPMYNTWNPYARNHWGYMTTFFFAPESYYASNGTDEHGQWNGVDGRAVNEMKNMVKSFHSEGIAVILDVVYNHVSNYDFHPFKYIDRESYFRLDEDGHYIAKSGCGNDTQTEHPIMRKLIVESLKYWMQEYHIDGFRFDLGYLIDAETRQEIIDELKQINPNVIILAEPWGGGYDPDGFSEMGWASFNDQFRNGVKGQNPNDGLGFIFGEWQGKNSVSTLQRFVTGSLQKDGGQYVDVSHSVNYLESHDDHTFGDFIRLGTKQVQQHGKVEDHENNATIIGKQLAMNKLGALYLLTSQGITFMHQGQEWGRSKVISETDVPEKKVGQIDHNSYEKDNETNWLNWNEKYQNIELVNYYKGLIKLRNRYSEFRQSDPEDFQFIDTELEFSVAYILKDAFLVVINGDESSELLIELPDGGWQVLVDDDGVNLETGLVIDGKVTIPQTSGMVLKRTH